MCGVFGYVAKKNRPLDPRVLRRVAAETMARGPHAWGLAWVDSSGRLRSYKQAGRVVDDLSLLKMAQGARLLIGHCRWATHGSPSDNTNNHPHDAGDALYVHNGVISHYRDLIEEHGLRTVTECDSEVIGLMVKKFRGKPLTRLRKAAEQAAGSNPFAVLALWPDRLIAAKANGQPLHVGETREAYWLASLPHGLPGEVYKFPESSLWEFKDAKVAAAV